MRESLEKIEKNLSSPRNKHLVGIMAVDAIRARLVKGQGFAPLSGATLEYRGGSGRPLQDTGSLRDSFDYRPEGDEAVIVSSDNPYAAVHNDGARIKAKKSWLYIPASAFTRTLQRRYGPGPKHVLAGLRSDGHSVFRRGRAIGYVAKGKGGRKGKEKITWVYWLKKEVVIPARKFFYLDDNDLVAILEEIEVMP